MRILSSIILVVFIADQSIGQIVLERQAISAFGLNMCSNECISSIAGQVDYQVCTNGEYSLTAGFEQPNGPLSFTVSLNIELDECNDTYTAEIVGLSQCGEQETLTFFWNGVEGPDSVGGLQSITTLAIISTGGCEYAASFDFSQMTVTSVPCELVFYSFLSPNNDGENDQWNIGRITESEYSENSVKFFNRWGGLVWETTGYDNAERVWWGENSQGELLPDGTYFYIVEANGRKFNGYVELIR